MNALGMLRPLSAGLRGLGKIFGLGGRTGERAVRTAAKTGAGVAARKVAKAKNPEAALYAGIADFNPQGFETILFKQLPRPKLTERSASDLTIEDAREYADQSMRFYDFDFPLFPKGDFFYEEVEEDFLAAALGRDENSIDRRFLDVMLLFRRTLNDNTRAMLVIWAPLIFTASLAAGVYFSETGYGDGMFASLGLTNHLAQQAAILSLCGLIGIFFAGLLFSWPFKVVQQRNLLNLDNYITSKFARINHNFQVAKRRALNVERNKRMNEREALKDEAGAWTLAYHWFAMRLFLCELTIRNKFYQVRRNTTLYWSAGAALSFMILMAFLWTAYARGAALPWLAVTAAVGAIILIMLTAMLARVAPMMFRVVEAHEWSRFHLAHLHNTVADHVGEDKVQIVTFRDRNRFE